MLTWPCPRLCVIPLAAFAYLVSPCSAVEWAQWRGPNRDGHAAASERVLTQLPSEIKPRWRIPIGEGYASPVIGGSSNNQRVVYLDLQDAKETLHSLDARTGRELWRQSLDTVFKDDWGQGPRCTPLIDGSRVIAQSCRGVLKCFDAEKGEPLWQKNYVQDFGAVFMGETGPAAGATRHGNTGAPLIDGDHVITQAGGLHGASLVCLNKVNGEVIWTSQDDTAGNASPILASLGGARQVISFTAKGLIGVDADNGKLLWRVPLATRLGRHITTPVVVDDMVLAGSFVFGLVAVKVTKEGSEFKAEQAWLSKEAATNFASPVAVNGSIYSVGLQKNIFCLEALTGKMSWSQTGLLYASGDRAFAAFIVIAGNILMLTDGGELILFAADPSGFQLKGRVQACGTTWCSPAYADGAIYLRDSKNLFCIELN